MQKISNIILYVFIGLLLAGGLLLFLMRDNLISNLQAEINAESEPASAAINLTAKDTIDPEIARDTRLASLTNYVVNFNFDVICRRPEVVNKVNTASGEGATATGTAKLVTPADCRLGTDFPFLVKK